jgi:phosphoserine phosphatase
LLRAALLNQRTGASARSLTVLSSSIANSGWASNRMSAPLSRRALVSRTLQLNMSSKSFSADDIYQALTSEGSKIHVGNDVARAMHALATADCVCFDVDSTVIQEEGIDVLADYLGYGEQVAALTKQAMEGGLKFQDALKARLDLLRPSRQQIQDCLHAHPLQLSPGVVELIQALQEANKGVYLVSGGFRIMIEPVAEILNIPKKNIVANTLLFDSNGLYQDFDRNEPTSRDMGKPKAVASILQANNYTTAVMVGDGATDAQAKPPAKAFVGFGGVVTREPVKALADWFVTDFEDMTRVVKEFGHK